MGLTSVLAKNQAKKMKGKRRAAMEQRRHHYEATINADSASWQPLMDSFDTNKTGSLEPEQLRGLLKLWNKGVEPTDEELALVIKIADKGGTGAIHIDEISAAGGT